MVVAVNESTSNSYTMGCPPVRGDNPRALASGLSYVQVDKHGITILYHLHQCRLCTSCDISCLSWKGWYKIVYPVVNKVNILVSFFLLKYSSQIIITYKSSNVSAEQIFVG